MNKFLLRKLTILFMRWHYRHLKHEKPWETEWLIHYWMNGRTCTGKSYMLIDLLPSWIKKFIYND